MNIKKNRKVKIEHFKNLVAVAFADGVLDEIENDFLLEKAEEIGLPNNEVKEIINSAEKLIFMVPINQENKEDQLADIVFMAMIDGHVHDKEYDLCLQIADKLGLSKNYLDQIIKLTKKLWIT